MEKECIEMSIKMTSEKMIQRPDGLTKSDRCLHTPGTFAKENLLYVQEVGKLESLKPHRCVRENLDSYLFLIVLEGKGSLVIRGKEYSVEKGDCAWIDCKEHFEHISDEKDAWKLAWVHFNGKSASGYYELFMKYHHRENIFRVQDVKSWEEIVTELLAKQKERQLQAELQSGEILLHLLNKIIISVADVEEMENEEEHLTAGALRERVNEDYAEEGVLQELEKAFGEKIAVLSAKFERQLGITLEEYISNRRYNAAKELLRFSVKSVETVARETGIGEVETLQKMFREKDGMTAEEYRQKWAGWIRN